MDRNCNAELLCKCPLVVDRDMLDYQARQQCARIIPVSVGM